MSPRAYYSVRTGQNPNAGKLGLPALRRLVGATYRHFLNRDYFQELLGKECTDWDGSTVGLAGAVPADFFFRKLRKDGLWPVLDRLPEYTEDDVFDVLEFLFDHISAGVEGYDHQYNQCGMHYSVFDRASAQAEFREAVNEFLVDYGPGFELSQIGEIHHLPDAGFDQLHHAPYPAGGEDQQRHVERRVDMAKAKYLARGGTPEQRMDAVRDLAGVLEYLRPQVKAVLSKSDESDLFELANKYSIRHHNALQRTDYDADIWGRWMFYYYLATIHACLRLLAREGRAVSGILGPASATQALDPRIL